MTTDAVSQTSLDKYLGAPLRRNKNTISVALSVIGAVGTVVAACLGHDISSLAGRIGAAAGSTLGAVALIGLNHFVNPGVTKEDIDRNREEYATDLGYKDGPELDAALRGVVDRKGAKLFEAGRTGDEVYIAKPGHGTGSYVQIENVAHLNDVLITGYRGI